MRVMRVPTARWIPKTIGRETYDKIRFACYDPDMGGGTRYTLRTWEILLTEPRYAGCHPDRTHYAHGLCGPCASVRRRRSRGG